MLCVICASVRFGSIVTTVGCREILVSFHFCGRNIFQLTRRRSSSLNRISQLPISWRSRWLMRCWRKKVVTRLSDSVASTR